MRWKVGLKLDPSSLSSPQPGCNVRDGRRGPTMMHEHGQNEPLARSKRRGLMRVKGRAGNRGVSCAVMLGFNLLWLAKPSTGTASEARLLARLRLPAPTCLLTLHGTYMLQYPLACIHVPTTH